MPYTQGTIKLADGTPIDCITHWNTFREAFAAAKRMKKSNTYLQVWAGDQGGRIEL